MEKKFLTSIADRLQHERRTLLKQQQRYDETFEGITNSREAEREEHAQEERDTRVLENLDERQQQRLADVDAALARIEAGAFGQCQNCGRPVGEDRLRSNPTTRLCIDCSARNEEPRENTEAAEPEPATRPALPPDLNLLDDNELAAHLSELVSADGQVDMDELEISARNGVVVLEGAVPSEGEHQILLNILTDVAGVQEIDDRLEIVRLPWERDDRSKDETSRDVAGTIPNQESYGGTEDVVLSEEEGVAYDPPANPPAPPYRKD